MHCSTNFCINYIIHFSIPISSFLSLTLNTISLWSTVRKIVIKIRANTKFLYFFLGTKVSITKAGEITNCGDTISKHLYVSNLWDSSCVFIDCPLNKISGLIQLFGEQIFAFEWMLPTSCYMAFITLIISFSYSF